MTAPWFSERLPALVAADSAPELVLLHGWGMSAAVWRSWLPLLRRRCNITLLDLPGFGQSPWQPGLTLESLLDQLAQRIPRRAALVGWSLGGMIAAAFIQRYPRHCAAFGTIACNPCFVARPDWPTAMPAERFAAFAADVAAQPEAALKRFRALQARGADAERELLKWLRDLDQPQPLPEALAWGLEQLQQLDVRAVFSDDRRVGLHIYGGADALVPAALAPRLGELAPHASIVLLDGASHLPFVSHPELCWQHLDRLVVEAGLLQRRREPQRNKALVAQSFSRAAATYDGAAALQRRVASALLAQAGVPAAGRLLDLGCGTGVIAAELVQRSAARAPEPQSQPSPAQPRAQVPHVQELQLPQEQPQLLQIVALDLAQGMVAHGRAGHRGAGIHWLCGDAENLPLADAALDAVYSSLALQWCENPDAVFAELRRVLRPGASAWIATLGPATLAELRAAWSAADDHVHVNRFADRDSLTGAVQRAGLACAQWREEVHTLEYAELQQLTRELKALGAHNVNAGRAAGLTGRHRLQRFRAAYETQRNSRGLLPATYQVWYLQLRKEDADV